MILIFFYYWQICTCTQQNYVADRISCPLKKCNFEANQLDDIRNHYSQAHPEFDFPEIRTGIVFTYRTNAAQNSQNIVRSFILYLISILHKSQLYKKWNNRADNSRKF